MQEEIENRSVNLVISTSRMSARVLMDGIRQFINNINSEARLQRESENRQQIARMEVRARQKEQRKAEGPHGKQTVKQLIRHSNGVKQVPLTEGSLKDFKHVLKKFGVDFALVKDNSSDKQRYLAFFKAKDEAVMASVLKECTDRQLHKSKEKRPSMLAEMKKLKAMVAKSPKKTHSKEKDLSL